MNKNINYDFDWSENILNKINDVILNIEENQKIEKLINEIKSSPYRKNNHYIDEIYIFYKLYKTGLSPREISELTDGVYGYSGIHRILLEGNLTRNNFEAQRIGATKRDYGQIRNKAKDTHNSRNTKFFGSSIEEYIRNKLDSILYDILPQDYEIIIGKNTMNILKQYENDIPVIIINNNNFYKIAIEFDGSYWHENNKNDEIKEKLLFSKGYTLFRINSKATITRDGELKYKKDLDDKIQKVADQIKSLIERDKTNNEIL